MNSLAATIERHRLLGQRHAVVAGSLRITSPAVATPADAPRKPSPRLLAPNERRRAPETVAVALEVALAACAMATARIPRQLPSVFASTHGDLAITDYMAATLATEPRTISPTRFHNSVHNAAAGYWTIGDGLHAWPQPRSARSMPASPRACSKRWYSWRTAPTPSCCAAYDSEATGPLASMSHSRGLLGGALVLARHGVPRPAQEGRSGELRLRATLIDGDPVAAPGALARHAAGNAMAPMLPLFDALATGSDVALLKAGPGRLLRVELAHG